LNRSLIEVSRTEVEGQLALGVPDRQGQLDIPVPGGGREDQRAAGYQAEEAQVVQEGQRRR